MMTSAATSSNIRTIWKSLFVIVSILAFDSTTSLNKPSFTTLALNIRPGFYFSSRLFNNGHRNRPEKTNSSAIHSSRQLNSNYKKWIHHPIGFFAQTTKKIKSIIVMSSSTDASSSSPTTPQSMTASETHTSSSSVPTASESVHLKLQSEVMKSSMRPPDHELQPISRNKNHVITQAESPIENEDFMPNIENTDTESESNDDDSNYEKNIDANTAKNEGIDTSASTFILHTYTDKATNITLQGLNVPKRKFYAWVDYTLLQMTSKRDSTNIQILKNKPPTLTNINEVTTEKICMDNNEDMRSHLRKVWRERRLVSERTEMLATYASDRMTNFKTTDRNTKFETSSKTNNGNKRGGFSDLLHTYSDRLIAIIEDEQDDFDLNQRSELNRENNEPNQSILNSRALLNYIQSDYGETETKALLHDELRRTSQEEQFKSVQHFLDWFRNTFPYYYDRCDTCQYSVKENPPPQDRDQSPENIFNANVQEEEGDTDNRCDEDEEQEDHSAFLGYVYPSEDELRGKATRTELYWCGKCGAFTRFPRFNSASWVVHKHRGRCGEYSMLLFRMLRALGLESRWVIDWADHVWAEVKIGDRWIHADPCEAALDKPLLYQEWGKQQNYIIAFNAPPKEFFNSLRSAKMDTMSILEDLKPLVEDVTSTYTSDSKDVLQNRRDESLSIIESSILKVEEDLKIKLNRLREKKLN